MKELSGESLSLITSVY